MITPGEHGEIKISAEEDGEGKEFDREEFRQAVKQTFVQVRRASTGDLYTRYNKQAGDRWRDL